MDIKFKALEINKFKSFVDSQVIRFEVLPTGLIFLRGENEVEPALESNGSGKSSVWDALSWCLYGKTVGGLRNPDIAPWNVKGSPAVELELEVDGVSRTVRRSCGPNRLTIDGKDSGADQVEALVGINFETFHHTVLLGQGQHLFFDLGPTDKLQLFTDALDLGRWDDRAARASAEAARIDLELADTDRQLVSSTSRLEQVDKLLEDAQRKSDSWSSDRRDLIERIEVDLEQSKKSGVSATKKKEAAELVEDGALTEKDAMEKAWKKEYDKLFELRDTLSSVRDQIYRKTDKMQELRKESKSLLASDSCPTCGQSIKGTELGKHKREIQRKIEVLRESEKKLGKDLEQHQVAYEDQESVIERMRPQMEEKAEIAKKARSEINMWTSRLADIKAEVEIAKKRLAQLESEANPYYEQIIKLKKDAKKFSASVNELNSEKKRLNRKLERTKFWVRGFKDVRLYIMQEVLLELQMATNAMLESVGLADWKIEYDIEQETKSGTIKRGLAVKIYSPRNEKIVRWESWSGGEGQRLRLVGSLALSEVLLSYAGVSTNLEILDEPNRGLSEGGIYDLCSFLRERSAVLGRQVWYTDQQSTESSLFSAVVTVRKTTDRGSCILIS